MRVAPAASQPDLAAPDCMHGERRVERLAILSTRFERKRIGQSDQAMRGRRQILARIELAQLREVVLTEPGRIESGEPGPCFGRCRRELEDAAELRLGFIDAAARAR